MKSNSPAHLLPNTIVFDLMFFRIILCFSVLHCCAFAAEANGLLRDGESLKILSLQDALDEALANNLGLLSARYRPANARDSVEIEAAEFDIEFFGSVSRSEAQAAASSSSLDSAAIPESEGRAARIGMQKFLSSGASVTVDSTLNRSSSNNNAARNPDYTSRVGISIRQPLLRDAWSAVNLAPLARARAEVDRSIFILRIDILDVLLETEIAYWNLAYARAQRSLIESSISLAENLLEENMERQRLGLITPLEVLQSETELVNQQEDIIQSERRIQDAEDVLRRLMGSVSFLDPIKEGILVAAMPSSAPFLKPIDVVVAETVATDLEAKAQEQAIEIQRINSVLAQDDTRPDLDLVGGIDYLGRDEDGYTAYRGAYAADGYDWNVGLELSFPWGFRDAEARMRQADRNVEIETLRLYDIKQQRALAARTAWRGVNTGLKRIEVTRKAMTLNEETFEQERARYGSGLVAYRRVLEAQRDFDGAKSNYLDAIIDTLRSAVRLSRVDGSILERNGYSWDRLDELSEPPVLEDRPEFNKPS